MQYPNKGFVFVLSLCAQLSFITPIHAEVTRAGDRALPQAVFAPGTEQRSLNLVSLFPLVVEDRKLGEVLVYDDPMTTRPVDYIELYDAAGDLVAVGWFDKFGIERMAVDRAILDGSDELEGVFVSFLEGESI